MFAHSVPLHPNLPVCTTLAFSGSSAFGRLTRKFDVVVIDEAAQSVEPSSLVPLAHGGAKQVYLVGDPEQLPATVMSRRALAQARACVFVVVVVGVWEGVRGGGGGGGALVLRRQRRPGLPTLRLPCRRSSVAGLSPPPPSSPLRSLQGYSDSLFKRLQSAGYPVHSLNIQVCNLFGDSRWCPSRPCPVLKQSLHLVRCSTACTHKSASSLQTRSTVAAYKVTDLRALSSSLS